MQIDRRFVPFLTSCAPAFENAMFGDLHQGWGGHIDHFSATSQADPTQTQITIWAYCQVMFDDVCRHASTTRPIMLALALLARRFLFGGWLLHIGFDKRRWRRFLLFQFFDPSEGDTQQFPASASILHAVPGFPSAVGSLLLLS